MNVPDLLDAVWRKSSRSGGNNGACVEIGFTDDVRAVRDTKDREGGCFTANQAQWATFLSAIKTGRYDR